MKKYNELELIGKLRADFQEEMEKTTKATELLPNFVSQEYIDWLEDREANRQLQDNSKIRERFDRFYSWVDGLTQSEYDDMSITNKCEKFYFKS